MVQSAQMFLWSNPAAARPADGVVTGGSLCRVATGLRRNRKASIFAAAEPCRHLGFVLALALVIWIVRIRYAVDVWVPFLWIMPAEPARLPLYVALFAVGVLAFGVTGFSECRQKLE
jgi:hypothetical protein